MNNIEEIFGEYLDSSMSAAAVTEANDRTIPGGRYKIEVTKVEPDRTPEDSPYVAGRPILKVQADALTKLEDGRWVKKGKVFFNVSPQEIRDERGRLDGPAKLWANLVGVVGRGATGRQVAEYLGQFPLTATVSKAYKTLEGKYAYANNADEERQLLSDGAEPRNFVRSLGAFNG